MKTFAAVLWALLATAGTAFAHGTGGGGGAVAGGPVMSPVSMPIFQPMAPIGGGPARSVTGDNNRRHQKKPATYQNTAPIFAWDPKICRPEQWIFTPNGAVRLGAAYPCGIDDNFVSQNYGPIPYWLPPAFLW